MEFCAIADEHCNGNKVYSKCFSCGEYACSMCSTRRNYYSYSTVRLCNNCQIEYDGNDKIVLERTLRLAGY